MNPPPFPLPNTHSHKQNPTGPNRNRANLCNDHPRPICIHRVPCPPYPQIPHFPIRTNPDHQSSILLPSSTPFASISTIDHLSGPLFSRIAQPPTITLLLLALFLVFSRQTLPSSTTPLSKSSQASPSSHDPFHHPPLPRLFPTCLCLQLLAAHLAFNNFYLKFVTSAIQLYAGRQPQLHPNHRVGTSPQR